MKYKKNWYLASIFEDTMDIIKERNIDTDFRFSHKYNEPLDMDDTSYDKKGDVSVVDMDTLDCAKSLIDDGFEDNEVCVLNMGSIWKYGGGVENGAGAQEECLCRRSTLYPMLKSYAEKYKDTYPNSGENDAIYTSNVEVLKDSSYNVLENPYHVNVITAAAIKHPVLIDGGLSPTDTTFLMHKIRNILNSAAFNGNRAIVLGAFGCGAYRCPAEDVARIFKHILFDEKAKDMFDAVNFAIIDDHNAFREDNKEGNYKAFKRIIEA